MGPGRKGELWREVMTAMAVIEEVAEVPIMTIAGAENPYGATILFRHLQFLNGNPQANAPLVGSRTGENGRAPQICHKFHSHRMKLA